MRRLPVILSSLLCIPAVLAQSRSIDGSTLVDVELQILRSYMLNGQVEQIAHVAETTADARLAMAAIADLRALQAEESLLNVYSAVKLPMVKALVIGAFDPLDPRGITGLAAISRDESEPSLRHRALFRLGTTVNPRTEDLVKAYQVESDQDGKLMILHLLSRNEEGRVALDKLAAENVDPSLKRYLDVHRDLMTRKAE